MSAAPPATATLPSFADANRVWSRVALLSFGGPAGQIAVMHRILVEEKRWIGERRFLHALQFCMLLPGPEAQQLATYLGWLLHGRRGGIAAGALFVLPGFLSILALSLAYARLQGTRFLEVAFFGLKAAVVAVVIDALIRLARRALRNPAMVAVAVGAFVATLLFRAPFAWVLFGAAAAGLVQRRFGAEPAHPAAESAAEAREVVVGDTRAAGARPSWRHTARVAALGLALWWLPVLALAIALGGSHVLVQVATFFGKVAVLSFGGAYAVLAYVAEEAVHTFGWLRPAEMLDGLGMAETTPGPLIMVVQFVAFMAALRHPGSLDPTWAGVAASVVATWVTFVPSTLWILLGSPYVERLREQRALNRALSAVAAAVVGVIAYLATWFALHVLFGRLTEVRWGPVRIQAPDLATFDVASLVIAAGALFALRRLRWGLLPAMAASVAVGAAWKVLGQP